MKTKEGHVKDLRDWLVLRNFSASTMGAYTCALRQFPEWRASEGLGVRFAREDARRYLLYRYDQGRRWQTINGDYSAMQKFYVHVLGVKWIREQLPAGGAMCLVKTEKGDRTARRKKC